MSNLTVVKLDTPELSKVGESKAKLIKQTFEPMATMLQEFEDRYSELISISKQGITDELAADAKQDSNNV